MSDNMLLKFFGKKLKKKRTIENLTFDLISYLAESTVQSSQADKDVALAKIIRETLSDNAFSSALAQVSGKMLDMFDEEGN